MLYHDEDRVEFNIEEFHSKIKDCIYWQEFDKHLDNLYSILKDIHITESKNSVNLYVSLIELFNEVFAAQVICDSLDTLYKEEDDIRHYKLEIRDSKLASIRNLQYEIADKLCTLLKTLNEDNNIFKCLSEFSSKL